MQKFKKIRLSQGKWALVDVEDFEWLSQYNWSYWKAPHAKYGYAGTNITFKGKRRFTKMHNLIMGVVGVDHANGNGIDNRRKNLRKANNFQQTWNTSKPITNKSGFKGVSLKKHNQKWVAQICFNKQKFHIGYFNTPLAAHRAYVKKAKELHGEFARWK